MKKNFTSSKPYLAQLLFIWLLFLGVAAQADLKIPPGWNINSRPLNADFSEGASELVWSRDGKWVACQGDEGIVIRDGGTLQARHFLSREALGWQANYDAPQLIAFVGNRIAFSLSEEEVVESGGHTISYPIRKGVQWRDLNSGRIQQTWNKARICDDSSAAYFTDGRGAFRVFHFDSARWFSISLPLRVTRFAPNIANEEMRRSAYAFAPELYFSPGGTRAADQIGNGRLRLWDVSARRKICELKDERGNYAANPGARGPVIWSPDKKRVATLGEDPEHQDFYYEQGPDDGLQNDHAPVIKIWDASNGKLLHWWRAAQNDDAPSLLRWLDNKRLAIGTSQNFEIWDALNAKRMVISPERKGFQIQSLQALSPDGSTLVAAASQRAKLYPELHVTALFAIETPDAQTLQAMTNLGPRRITKLAWNSNGKYLAVCSYEYINVWQMTNHHPQNLAAVFSDGDIKTDMGWTIKNRLRASERDQLLLCDAEKQWRSDILKPIHNSPGGSAYDRFFITSNEQTFLQVTEDQTQIWRLDARQKEPYLWLKTNLMESFIQSVSPDGRFCSVSEQDKKTEKYFCTLYDLQIKNRKLRLDESPRQGAGDVRSYTGENIAQFSRNGKRAAFGGRIFSLPDGKVLGERRDPFDGNALALSSNGALITRLSTYGKNAGVRLFEATSDKFLRVLSLDTGGITAAEFSPDDRVLCIARFGDLEFYDVASGKLLSKAVVLPPANPAAKANAARGVTWRVPQAEYSACA